MPAAPAKASRQTTIKFGFTRAARLALPADFVAALRQRPTVRSRTFALHLRRRAASFPWRFGLVVAKRFEARSVGRNAIKRTWREALRVVAPTLEKAAPSHDLVVRLLAKPARSDLRLLRADCRAEAERLLDELQQKLPGISQETACAASSSS